MSSEKIESDVAFIKALAKLLRDSDLTEIEVEREYGDEDELKVRLSRAAIAMPAAAPAPAAAPVPQQTIPVPATAAPAAQTPPEPRKDAGMVPSPMVGTVYLSPEPGATAFVKVGDTVTKGQTVVIIEAMKTMNQIASPRAGTVKEVLVQDAEPVEFGSPLMIIE